LEEEGNLAIISMGRALQAEEMVRGETVHQEPTCLVCWRKNEETTVKRQRVKRKADTVGSAGPLQDGGLGEFLVEDKRNLTSTWKGGKMVQG
jgi:hypothetical protein